mgnify:CR=1 FL=1
MILVKLSDYQLLMQLPDMNTEHLLIKKFTIHKCFFTGKS